MLSMRVASDGFWARLLISQTMANGFRFTNLNMFTTACEKFFPNFESHRVKYDVPGSREQNAELGFAETDEERESMSNVPYLEIVGSIT